MLMLILRRGFASVSGPFSKEFQALSLHSTLLNQTTPETVRMLVDVHPMMKVYEFLRGARQVDAKTFGLVSYALSRTTRDCSYVFRRLSQRDKRRILPPLFKTLTHYCDAVSKAISESKEEDNRLVRPMSSLLNAYEIANPAAGVSAFYLWHQPKVTASAIPCMVKSLQPLESIESAFGKAPQANFLLLSKMIWAYLCYDRSETAVSLWDNVSRGQNWPQMAVDSVYNSFIGDCMDANIAKSFFVNYNQAPHPAAMTRLLARCWTQSHDIEEQLELFSTFLLRSQDLSESKFKTVTYQVVANVLEEPSLDNVAKLVAMYDSELPHRTVLLNILLTKCIENGQKSLAMLVLRAYDPESDPVSYRVRLNACEALDLDPGVVEELWNARIALRDSPLDALDWFAVVRATHGDSRFVSLWSQEGRPFEKDIRNFCRSKGYQLEIH